MWNTNTCIYLRAPAEYKYTYSKWRPGRQKSQIHNHYARNRRIRKQPQPFAFLSALAMPVAGRGLVLRAAHDSQPIMRRTIHDTRLCHQSQSLTTDPHHAMGASDRYSTTQRRMPSSQVQSLRMMDVRFDACCASAERLVAVLAID